MNPVRSVFIFVMLAGTCCAQDKSTFSCQHSDELGKREHTIRDTHLVLNTVPDPDYAGEKVCELTIRRPGFRKPLVLQDWGLTLVSEGLDVDDDQVPDLVVEGYSGGAHCCMTYWIVSLARKPRISFRMYNERDVEFVDLDSDGKVEIATLDGAFDYFENSHAHTIFPSVYLRLHSGRLMDVSHSFRARYDDEIRQLKSKMDPAELRKMKAQSLEDMDPATKGQALGIVFAYLYSGRDAEAWQALRTYFPPTLVESLRQSILQTRATGILRCLRSVAKCGSPGSLR